MKVEFFTTQEAASFLGVSTMVFRYWANKLGVKDVHVQRPRPQGKAPLMWRVVDVEWLAEHMDLRGKNDDNES